MNSRWTILIVCVVLVLFPLAGLADLPVENLFGILLLFTGCAPAFQPPHVTSASPTVPRLRGPPLSHLS